MAGPWDRRQKTFAVSLIRVEAITVELIADSEGDAAQRALAQEAPPSDILVGAKVLDVHLVSLDRARRLSRDEAAPPV